MEFGLLLRLFGVMKPILIWSHPFNIQGRDSYICDLKKKKKKGGLYSGIYRLISFKLGMTGTTKLYILMSLDDLDLHSRSELYDTSKALVSIFSKILQFDRFSVLPQSVGLLKLMLSLFCTSSIQFIKYRINIVMRLDMWEPVCCKLGMNLDATGLYILIPV